MKGVLLGLAIVALVLSCATGGPGPTIDPTLQMEKRNEITQLWAQVRVWRGEMGLDLDPDASALIAIRHKSVKDAQKVCPENRKIPKTCEDTCTIADHICDNAELICKIADELGKQDRSQEKCTSAKASCRDAKKKCCGCKPPPVEEPLAAPVSP